MQCVPGVPLVGTMQQQQAKSKPEATLETAKELGRG